MLPDMYQQRVKTEIDRFDSFRGEETNQLSTDIRVPTAAMFAFRSVVIDYLWIRAETLKQEGQYFDAMYIARAICALQPNLASVWDFQGWNMAYNISVGLPTGSERWHWVKSGFELLRDLGLKYNPRSLKIHWSIAWIFQHKIGAIADDYHRYYKTMFAYEMAPLLTPCYSVISARCTFEDIQAMAELPETFAELLNDQAVADMVDALLATDDNINTADELLDVLVKFRTTDNSKYSQSFFDLILANKDNPAFQKIDRFSRAKVLKATWKLEPKAMHRLNQLYGPIDYVNSGNRKSLDWRTPWPYAIYWADHGLQYRDQDWSRNEMNITRLERVIYTCLQDLYSYGNLKIFQFRPVSAFSGNDAQQEVLEKQQLELQVFNSQDLEMFQVAYKATVDLDKYYQDHPDQEPPASLDIARENLVRNGIQSLYLTGFKEYAVKYYNQLKIDYPDKEDYKVTLDEFVKACMKEQILQITPKYASDYILNLLRDSYYQLAVSEDENAYVREQWALQIYEYFMKDFQNDPDPTKRTALPSIPDMKYQALVMMLSDDSVNPNIKALLMARIELEQPSLYDRIMKEINRQRQEIEKAAGDSSNSYGPQQQPVNQ